MCIFSGASALTGGILFQLAEKYKDQSTKTKATLESSESTGHLETIEEITTGEKDINSKDIQAELTKAHQPMQSSVALS